MGKESALRKVRDDSACAQNGESRCFRVTPRQPQGQLCRLCLLLLLPAAMADIPTPLTAPAAASPGVLLRCVWSGHGSALAAHGETEPVHCRARRAPTGESLCSSAYMYR